MLEDVGEDLTGLKAKKQVLILYCAQLLCLRLIPHCWRHALGVLGAHTHGWRLVPGALGVLGARKQGKDTC